MVELYGQSLTRRAVAERSGSLAAFAGVRLMTLGDGVERGVRMLEFRTGTGLRFTLLVDRAMDVADCEFRGQAIGWQSPTGFRHPGLNEYEGEDGLGFLRSFSGLLATCGLDHVLGVEEVSAESYGYPRRATVRHSLHGRVGMIPARLTGYGEALGRAIAACSGPRAWCGRRRCSRRTSSWCGGWRRTSAATRSGCATGW